MEEVDRRLGAPGFDSGDGLYAEVWVTKDALRAAIGDVATQVDDARRVTESVAARVSDLCVALEAC